MLARIRVLVAHDCVENRTHELRFNHYSWHIPNKAPVWVPLKHDNKCNDMNQQETEKDAPEFDLFQVGFILP